MNHRFAGVHASGQVSGAGIEHAADDVQRAFVQLSFEALEEFRFPQNEADLLPGIALSLQGYADEPADLRTGLKHPDARLHIAGSATADDSTLIGDPIALATAWHDLIQNPTALQSFGEKGRHAAELSYSVQAMRERFLAQARKLGHFEPG